MAKQYKCNWTVHYDGVEHGAKATRSRPSRRPTTDELLAAGAISEVKHEKTPTTTPTPTPTPTLGVMNEDLSVFLNPADFASVGLWSVGGASVNGIFDAAVSRPVGPRGCDRPRVPLRRRPAFPTRGAGRP
jgi:hypothetical protein